MPPEPPKEARAFGARKVSCRLLSQWGRLLQNLLTALCIDFCVDKDIILHGMRIIGSESRDYVAMVYVTQVTDDGEKSCPVVSKSGIFPSVFIRVHSKSFVYNGFNVLFDCPVDLTKNVRYRVSAIIDGPPSPRGLNFKTSIISHGVKFYFIVEEESYDFDDTQFAEFLFQHKRLH